VVHALVWLASYIRSLGPTPPEIILVTESETLRKLATASSASNTFCVMGMQDYLRKRLPGHSELLELYCFAIS
jgi:hypothetical protein